MKGFGTVQPKILGMLVAAFVAGATVVASPLPQAIAAVIATDVQCTGCVGASDLAASAVTNSKVASGAISPSKISSNAITSGKIADGTITAADVGTDAIGADELQGVTKLMFSTCTVTQTNSISPGAATALTCSIPGAEGADKMVMTMAKGSTCFSVARANPFTDGAAVFLWNHCTTSAAIGETTFSAILYKNG